MERPPVPWFSTAKEIIVTADRKREQTILVLSGGHALGAVQGGVWEALEQAGIVPDWIIGTSVGAVNGAIVAGNPPERRLAALKDFWSTAPGTDLPWPEPATAGLRRAMGALHAGRSLLFGREALFWPRLGLADFLGRPSLFDRRPLRLGLARLVDFDRLNGGEIRFSLNACDIVDGREVIFDNRSAGIATEHLLASSAFLPDFEPIEIGGRWLADGGLAANVSCDTLTMENVGYDVRCIVVDLFQPSGKPPGSLEAGFELRQDLAFHAQTLRTFALWRHRWEARSQRADGERFHVLHLSYRQTGDDLALKTHDYSGAALRRRWEAGRAGTAACLAASDDPPAGFSVTAFPLGHG